MIAFVKELRNLLCTEIGREKDQKIEKLCSNSLKSQLETDQYILAVYLVSLLKQNKFELANKHLKKSLPDLLIYDQTLTLELSAHIIINCNKNFDEFFSDNTLPNMIKDLLKDLIKLHKNFNEQSTRQHDTKFSQSKDLLEQALINSSIKPGLFNSFLASSYYVSMDDSTYGSQFDNANVKEMNFGMFFNFILAKILYFYQEVDIEKDILTFMEFHESLSYNEERLLNNLNSKNQPEDFLSILAQFQSTKVNEKILYEDQIEDFIKMYNSSIDVQQKLNLLGDLKKSENDRIIWRSTALLNSSLLNIAKLYMSYCTKDYKQSKQIFKDISSSLDNAKFAYLKSLLIRKFECSSPQNSINSTCCSQIAKQFLVDSKKGASCPRSNDPYIAKTRMKKTKKATKNKQVSKHWLSKHERNTQTKKSKSTSKIVDSSSSYVKGTQGVSVDEINALELDMSKVDVNSLQNVGKRNSSNNIGNRNRNRAGKQGKKK